MRRNRSEGFGGEVTDDEKIEAMKKFVEAKESIEQSILRVAAEQGLCRKCKAVIMRMAER